MRSSIVSGNVALAAWARVNAQGELLEAYAEVSDQQMGQRFRGYDGSSEKPFIVAQDPQGAWRRFPLAYADTVADADGRVGRRDRYRLKLDATQVSVGAAQQGVAFGMEAKIGGEVQEFYLQQFNRNPKAAAPSPAQPWDAEQLPPTRFGWWKVTDGYRSWKFSKPDLAKKAVFLLRQGSPGARAFETTAPDPSAARQFQNGLNPEGPFYL